MIFTRHALSPILTRNDIPDVPPDIVDATSVFNPGAARVNGRDLLLLRVQTRGRRTFLMVAEGPGDGSFVIRPEPVELVGFEGLGEHIHHIYDPRITRLEGSWHVAVAVAVDSTSKLAVAKTDDFRRLEFVGAVCGEDVRNGVLFPERIADRYAMLVRPNRVRVGDGPTTGDTIVLATSDDLVSWREEGPVMSGRWHYWDEIIGPGPPPIKTREGWLLVYHGVATHLTNSWIYQAGVALLDLDDPKRVVARGRDNVLEPRELYETAGQVPNVVFPSGLVCAVVDDDGFAPPHAEARLYYGAADTCVGFASTTIGRLLAACRI